MKTFFQNRQKAIMVSVLVFAFLFTGSVAFGALTFSGTAINSDGDLTLTSTNGMELTSSGTYTFKRPTAGTVTMVAADDDVNAALTISSGGTGILTLDPTGAGSIAIGSADVTGITITTDANATNDVNIIGGITGSTSITANTYVQADAYRVTRGDTISVSGDLTKAQLQAASIFHVDTFGGDVDIDLWEDGSPDMGEIGRVITFIQVNGTNTLTVTAGLNAGQVITFVGAGGAVNQSGDMIVCHVAALNLTSCITYARD
jgi:hypothetical protein